MTKKNNKEYKRLKRNLDTAIRKAKKNDRPLRIGKNKKGETLYIRGESAKRERIRIAKMNYQYQQDLHVDKIRMPTNLEYKVTAGNMKFNSRGQYNAFMKHHTQLAQKHQADYNGNSRRKSFQTVVDNLEVSKRVMDELDQRFKQLSHRDLLHELVKNSKGQSIVISEVFGSDQIISDTMEYEQLVKIYKLLGMSEQAKNLTPEDIHAGYYDNRNFTHIDRKLDAKREFRQSIKRV